MIVRGLPLHVKTQLPFTLRRCRQILGADRKPVFFQSNDILCDQAATGIKNHNKLQTQWLKRLKLFCFEEVNFKMNKNNKLEDNF